MWLLIQPKQSFKHIHHTERAFKAGMGTQLKNFQIRCEIWPKLAVEQQVVSKWDSLSLNGGCDKRGSFSQSRIGCRPGCPWMPLLGLHGTRWHSFNRMLGPDFAASNWALKSLLLFFFFSPLFFYCCSSTVVSFSHHHFPSPHPQSYPPLALSMGLLYTFLDDRSSSFCHYPPLPSSLVTVSLLFISMSLVLFACLFVLLISFHL